jgi:ABC-type antimicrobial peptide transport system permease subunit
MITAGLWRVAPGLLLGFVVCAGFSPLLGALLGSMDPRDPFIYLGVYGGYLVVTVLAMLIPARRAARLDPVRVLRKD